ncbi:MAG: exodeoxyribonuclease III [Patescibacteria group bacterium]|nr:exodeoxyribonuclease III [Patescibacteria group bacterium]
MEILSWNVNGIRAVARKGFLNFLKKQKPDILCLQEIKISDIARLKENFDFGGYKEYWHPAERPGYSGTAILVKEGLATKILPYLDWDNEGRVQVLDCGFFYLVNVYFPNANHELSRLDFKLKFNDKLLKYLKKLEEKKPLIITGDFNVAHEEIDLARPKDNIGNPGFTHEERNWMTKFLSSGFIDTFRYFNKNKVQYSWWSYRFSARARNIGWRIDYFCVSAKFIKQVKRAFIFEKIHGSDHCPVGIEVE